MGSALETFDIVRTSKIPTTQVERKDGLILRSDTSARLMPGKGKYKKVQMKEKVRLDARHVPQSKRDAHRIEHTEYLGSNVARGMRAMRTYLILGITHARICQNFTCHLRK